MLDTVEKRQITISAPEFEIITLKLVGTAPYMQARFSEKAKAEMRAKMCAGSTAKKGKARKARNFDDDYKAAMYISQEGWNGMPASAFRNAAIRACSAVGFQMTSAKMSIFIEADGFDAVDGTPLVRIYGEPEPIEMAARVAQTTDIRVRPLWREWSANVRVRYDRGQFTDVDVYNLMMRVGMQVGIGEGRPFSRNSAGLGFGLFKLEDHYDSV